MRNRKELIEQRIRILRRAIRKERNKYTRKIYKEHLNFLKSEHKKLN